MRGGRRVELKYHNRNECCAQEVRNVSAHYWGIGWLAQVQNSRSPLFMHDPYARFGWARIPHGFRPEGSISMSFYFLIKAVVIHICLVPLTVSPINAVYVASEFITSHTPFACPSDLLALLSFCRHKTRFFFTSLATLMPQSLQPKAHTALHTSNEMP